jgi:seryl-tRNA synthetase
MNLESNKSAMLKYSDSESNSNFLFLAEQNAILEKELQLYRFKGLAQRIIELEKQNKDLNINLDALIKMNNMLNKLLEKKNDEELEQKYKELQALHNEKLIFWNNLGKKFAPLQELCLDMLDLPCILDWEIVEYKKKYEAIMQKDCNQIRVAHNNPSSPSENHTPT